MKFLQSLPLIVAAGLIGVATYSRNQPVIDYDNSVSLGAKSNMLRASEYDQLKAVIDGDTVELRSRGRIRLCGIDAPEAPKKDEKGNVIDPGQPLGAEATKALETLVKSRDNEVIVVPVEQDKYGRTVAELFVKTAAPDEEIPINAEMVKRGMAYHYKQFSNRCPNGNVLDRAEEIAQQKKAGVWNGGSYQKPWDYRRTNR